MKEQLLFDLIETEALLNVYLDRPGFTPNGAGLIVTGSALGHFPRRRGHKVTLWFGRGLVRESYKTKNEAYMKVIEILGKSTTPIEPRFEGRDVKKFLKVWNALEVKK